ncbi:MAG: TRAP transporter large permease subunit, partial [Rubrivivax sp.]|nr:TRAP transporter large permease subunit [Rubrivivax sp.]
RDRQQHHRQLVHHAAEHHVLIARHDVVGGIEVGPAAFGREHLRPRVRRFGADHRFVVVFGGIYGGVFSPTEGAAVGAVGTLVAGLGSRELTWQGIGRSFVGAAETSAMVFMIFLGADMFNSALAVTQTPATLAAWVSGLDVPPLAVVGFVLVFYVVLGCVMDELSMVLLTIPVLFPTIMGLELWGLGAEGKAIWFGILVLITMGIGLIAPPVGLNVYVVNGIAKDVPMGATYRGVFAFLASDVARVLLLLFFPSISLALVRWLYG